MAYALVTKEEKYLLKPGKNVIGRSSVPVDGVSFVSIDSPLAAISRMQAFIDIAPNGDVWLSDCNSTNGTYLAVRDGDGLRLEANRYYQLSEGSRIVFGDVECTFVNLLDGQGNRQRQPEAGGNAADRVTDEVARQGSSTSIVKRGRTSIAATRPTEVVTGPLHQRSIPYLDDSAAASTTPARETESAVSSSSPNSSSAKRSRVESTRSAVVKSAQDSSAASQPLVICLSGMDGDERAAVAKRARQLKGKVSDDIVKANMLVVATPAVRTPKFIIAVGRSIPVVSSNDFCKENVDLDELRRRIVSLKMKHHTYSSAALEKIIFRSDPTPLLQSQEFNISALSSKSKSVAAEIIEMCGGKANRPKNSEGIRITDETLDTLYDAILRGRVPDGL